MSYVLDGDSSLVASSLELHCIRDAEVLPLSDLVQQSESTFFKAILTMGAAQTKKYNFETRLQIDAKFGNTVADSWL